MEVIDDDRFRDVAADDAPLRPKDDEPDDPRFDTRGADDELAGPAEVGPLLRRLLV